MNFCALLASAWSGLLYADSGNEYFFKLVSVNAELLFSRDSSNWIIIGFSFGPLAESSRERSRGWTSCCLVAFSRVGQIGMKHGRKCSKCNMVSLTSILDGLFEIFFSLLWWWEIFVTPSQSFITLFIILSKNLFIVFAFWSWLTKAYQSKRYEWKRWWIISLRVIL